MKLSAVRRALALSSSGFRTLCHSSSFTTRPSLSKGRQVSIVNAYPPMTSHMAMISHWSTATQDKVKQPAGQTFVNEDRTVRSPLGPPPKAKKDLWSELYTKLSSVDPQLEILVDSHSGDTATVQEVLVNVDNIAANLVQQGFNRSFPVAFVMVNGIEYAQIVLAVLKLGGFVALISPQSTSEDIGKYLELVNAGLVICDEMTVANVMNGATKSSVKKIFSTCTYPGSISVESLFTPQVLQPDHIARAAPSEIAIILFSSGTTGFPKGVELSHGTIASFLHVLSHHDIDFYGEQSVLIYQPFSHLYGLFLLYGALSVGVPAIIMKRFDMEEYVKIACRHKFEKLHFVPPLAVQFTKGGFMERYDLSSVREVICGAASLSDDVVQELYSQSQNRINLRQLYGMSEGFGTFCPVRHRFKEYPNNTVGLPFPGCIMKVVDPVTGESLGPMEKGELCMQSELRMIQYHKNQRATEEAIDKDGWLHTGDIAYYDEEGFFYIVDRLKEIIKYNARQVSPAELENVLLSHPDVADAGVTGLPHTLAGEVPFAYVVLKPGRTTTEKQLHDFVNERVASYKQLRGGIQFVSLIPKTPSGKMLRRVIKQEQLSKTRNAEL